MRQREAAPARRAAASAAACRRRRHGLVHVFPVRRVQAPGEHDEHAEEDSTQTPTRMRVALRRLAHPLQVGDQVGDRLVVLAAASACPGVTCSKPAKRVLGLAVLVRILRPRRSWRARWPCSSHSTCGMPTSGTRGCSSRSAACRRGRTCAGRCRGSRRRCPCRLGARARDHRQVGRRGAEPVLRLLRVERDLHRVADLVGRRTAGSS